MALPAPAAPDPPTFSATLHEAAAPLWARQAGLPFLRGLADGSLAPAKFLFYTAQDAYFLREMNRVFGYAAARADRAAEMGAFAGLLIETDRILADLHGRYAARQGVSRGGSRKRCAPRPRRMPTAGTCWPPPLPTPTRRCWPRCCPACGCMTS